MQKKFLAGVILLVIAAGAILYRVLADGTPKDGAEVTWEMLGQLDYVTGQAGSELKALDGKRVKIPGFMVPLEDSMKEVSEFLLVPTPQACIHVPPPPPNQMVFVKMLKPAGIAYGAIWIYGTLHLTPKKHMYGESSFEFDGDSIEAYR